MGMFDTVHFECPHCGKDADVQTKAGPCHLRDYQLSEVTGSIAEDLVAYNGITCGYRRCYACEMPLEFIAEVSVKITVRKPE